MPCITGSHNHCKHEDTELRRSICDLQRSLNYFNEESDPGTLKPGEPHPSAHSAYMYVQEYIANINKLAILKESLASCALDGNREAEICLATLDRLLNGKPISDRYLLGLAWMLKGLR